jgi:hypothetical protein
MPITLTSYKEKFIQQLEDTNRSIFLGLPSVKLDNVSGKYMIIQLFELSNSIGLEITAANLTILGDIVLYGRICN